MAWSVLDPSVAHRRVPALRIPLRARLAAVLATESLLGLLGFAVLTPGFAAAERLLVVMSGDARPYQQALDGIRQSGAATEAFQASAGNEEAIGALRSAGRDDAIVTLGGRAAEFAAQAAPAAPVVNCMAIGGDGKPAPGALVVPLDIPMDTQVLWLKRLLPNAAERWHTVRPGAKRTAGRRGRGGADARRLRSGAGARDRTERAAQRPDPPHEPRRRAARNSRHDGVRARELAALCCSRFAIRFRSRAQPSRGCAPARCTRSTGTIRISAAIARRSALRQLGGRRAAAPPPPRTRVIVNAALGRAAAIRWDAETLRIGRPGVRMKSVRRTLRKHLSPLGRRHDVDARPAAGAHGAARPSSTC